MKAVILAAGKGTRMRELTNELPKPMLRHQGKPILEHIVAGSPGAVLEIFRSSRGDEALTSSSKWFGASSRRLLQIHQT